jgi:hypothetical protein
LRTRQACGTWCTFARRAQGAISQIEAAEIKAIAPQHVPALEPA